MQVAMILRSLPKAFDALTTALESHSDKELTMELVQAKLIDETEKLYGEKGQVERVLKVKSEAKPGGCFFCGRPGHKKRECKEFLNRKSSRDSENRKKSKAEKRGKSEKSVRKRHKTVHFHGSSA